MATPESKIANAKLRVGEPECNVLPDVVKSRRKIRPPIQPVCGKGDVMLRDLRTWHAGMPNESDDYRIMIALGYKVSLDQRTSLPSYLECDKFRSADEIWKAQWYPNQ
jgi:hypothetical protein